MVSYKGLTFVKDSFPKSKKSFTVKARAYDEAIRHSFSTNATPNALDIVRDGDTTRMVQSVVWAVKIGGGKRKSKLIYKIY